MADPGAQAGTRASPDTHVAGVRLVASASMIYRAGDSGCEIYEKLEGEGSSLVGGKMIGGKPSAAGEHAASVLCGQRQALGDYHCGDHA